MAADAAAGETGPAGFGILGPLEVSRSGCVLPLGGPRQRAVLALLLLLLEANQVVSMDRLAEDIWDGHPPEGWATTLQTYVIHLRRALEPGRARGIAGNVLVTTGRRPRNGRFSTLPAGRRVSTCPICSVVITCFRLSGPSISVRLRRSEAGRGS